MKRIIMILAVVAMNVMILGTTCLAKENEGFVPPNKITVEGGKLELVNIQKGINTVQPRYTYKVVTDGGNLNVRSGPGTSYSIVGQIANGSYVDVSFMQEAGIYPWVYGSGTSTTGKEISGYMHSDYLGNSEL